MKFFPVCLARKLWQQMLVPGLIALAALLQALSAGPVLQRLLNLFFPGKLLVSFKGPGLFLPALYFHVSDFRLIIPGNKERDRVYLQIKSLRFFIQPFLLLIGRIVLKHFRMEEPELYYFNRQPSYEKNRYLPPRHRVEIQKGLLTKGEIYILDESYSPPYPMSLSQIELENADLDLGTPVDVLFRSARGSASLGSGLLEIGRSGAQGIIRLWGVTWAELAGRRDSFFGNSKIGLLVTHAGGTERRQVQGIIGNIASGKETAQLFERKNLSPELQFDFELSWDELRLTFDLGLQRIIGKLIGSATASGLSKSILPGLRSLFDLLKKKEEA